jgi:GTP cyclohydrolase IA
MEKNDERTRQLAEDGIRALLQHLGQDTERSGIVKTPERVVKAFVEMTSGYNDDPATILSTTFDQEGEEYDGLILLRDIPFVSLCEHHLLPFTGTVAVGYIPNHRTKQVVGLSKLARLAGCYAKRLQLQEQMTMQIGTALMKHLNPEGAMVVVKANHSCMSCRGVGKQAEMVTKYVYGSIDQAEFFEMMRC